MRILALVLAAALVAACTPSPAPTPMPPDASDSSAPPAPTPSPTPTPSPPAPPAPPECIASCAALAKTCSAGKVSNCAQILAAVQTGRLVRNPSTGMPLTCKDQLTPAVLSTLGWTCQ